MDVAEFLRQLEDQFGLTVGTLKLSSIVEETPGWSSLMFLELIAFVDDCYGITVKPRQIHECTTVANLFSLVQSLSSSMAVA
ncbi:acyl carrier protein [Schlesneria paludicola]|uniref:acyl carrier protein n=1 Tax=Schlesneria paludicola TaxID=360056 RepID=UPI00029B2178|nr:acyl carrier protein [Schlesneria paludicola]